MELIDRAARSLVDHPVPPELRAAVMARIDKRRAHPWRWPLAAAAMTTLGVLAWLAGTLPGVVKPRLPDVGAPPQVALRGAAVPNPPADLRLTIGPARRARPGALTEAERAWRARAIPALDAPAPLAVTVTQPDAVVLPLLTVTPLAPSRVVVPPLDPQRWGRERR
jgi:hypothetical protein